MDLLEVFAVAAGLVPAAHQGLQHPGQPHLLSRCHRHLTLPLLPSACRTLDTKSVS